MAIERVLQTANDERVLELQDRKKRRKTGKKWVPAIDFLLRGFLDHM